MGVLSEISADLYRANPPFSFTVYENDPCAPVYVFVLVCVYSFSLHRLVCGVGKIAQNVTLLDTRVKE